jgi:CheY-like chemotaxis protein
VFIGIPQAGKNHYTASMDTAAAMAILSGASRYTSKIDTSPNDGRVRGVRAPRRTPAHPGAPIRRNVAMSLTTLVAKEMPGRGERSMAVVVAADDNPDMLALFRLAALRGGHTVLPASDGATALRLVRDHVPDLLVTGNNMPGLTGRQLAAHLATDPATRDVPVLLVSGPPNRTDVPGLEHVSSVMTKPFRVDELRARIDMLLNAAPS